MLHILLLEVFELIDSIFLPAAESVWLNVVIIHAKLNMLHETKESFFAAEVILVGRVGDFVSLTINFDEVLLHTLEDHSAEDVLVVGCEIDHKKIITCSSIEPTMKAPKSLTYIWTCGLGL